MPSMKKQMNVRIDEETEELLPKLQEAMSASIGIVISQSDIFRLGVAELRKKYLPEPAEKSMKKP